MHVKYFLEFENLEDNRKINNQLSINIDFNMLTN